MDVIAVREAVAEGLRQAREEERPTAARGLHLPLPRPLRRRPRGLPRARGGRGVAGERPDRELRPALRRGGRAGRARGRAGARGGRGDGRGGGRVRRRLAGAGARHDVREPLRADRYPGGWYAVDERSPEPHRGEHEADMPARGARAGRGRRRLRRGRGGGRRGRTRRSRATPRTAPRATADRAAPTRRSRSTPRRTETDGRAADARGAARRDGRGDAPRRGGLRDGRGRRRLPAAPSR